jgi:hypothetical protein
MMMMRKTQRFTRVGLGTAFPALFMLSLAGGVAASQKVGFAAERLDRFGGTKTVQSEATGFFRVEEIGDRWWFVTPEGNGFLSAGVNHVDYRADYSDDFVDSVTGHLRDWGFNTIGWSQEVMGRDAQTNVMVHSAGWGPKQYARAKMPYMHLIRFTDMEWYVEEEFPDVFSDAFAEKCDSLAKDVCTQLCNDPYLIGYFYSDAPNWPLWAQKVGKEKLPEVLRAQPKGSWRSLRGFCRSRVFAALCRRPPLVRVHRESHTEIRAQKFSR